MMWKPVLRWSLALILAFAAHLFVFNLVPERTAPVLIEGGAMQVQLGLDVSVVSARSGIEDETEQEPPTDEHEDTPAPEPEPEVQSEPEPAQEMPPALQTRSETQLDLPTESPPEPDEVGNAEPETHAEQDAPTPDSPAETAPNEQQHGLEQATDDLMQQPGGETAEPSDQTTPADVETEVETGSNQVGNALNSNYAGTVMQHLSRMRRPRASSPGSTYVQFTIAPDGHLESLSIQTGSQSSRFDREALRMIERAQPFPLPPAGVNREFVVEIEGR